MLCIRPHFSLGCNCVTQSRLLWSWFFECCWDSFNAHCAALCRERQESDEASERQRQQKYGRSRQHRAHEHMEGGHSSAPKRRKDFLGYYKIMNMDPEGMIHGRRQ